MIQPLLYTAEALNIQRIQYACVFEGAPAAGGVSHGRMATRRVSAASVVSYFNGDEAALSEVFMEGSDDELGMEDEYSESDEESEEHMPGW